MIIHNEVVGTILNLLTLVVTGNPRVYKALKNELAKVLNELKSLKKGENVSEDLLEVIQLITVTMDGMKDE